MSDLWFIVFGCPRRGAHDAGVSVEKQVEAERAELDSALARELLALHPRLRNRLGLTDAVIAILDGALVMLRMMLDDSDNRSLDERLEDLAERLASVFPTGLTEEEVTAFELWIETRLSTELPRWLKYFATPQGRSFWVRLLGRARVDRHRAALIDDGALLVVGARRLLRWGMPVAVALDDCIRVLPPSKRTMAPELTPFEKGLLEAAVALDGLLDQLVEKQGMTLDGLPVRETELTALQMDMHDLAQQLHAALAVESLRAIEEVDAVLARKLRGFEDALERSADGASQASGSLVEFVDRLLRTVFTSDFVLEWVDAHAPNDEGMTYTREQKRLPTKQAQALCFLSAGRAPAGDGKLERLLAASLRDARTELQKIKHADLGTPEEADEVRRLSHAIKGFFVYAIRTSWASAGSDNLADLRARFV